MDMLLLLAVNYGICLSPVPFPAPFHHRVVQQSIKKHIFEVYTDTKHAWYKSFARKTTNCTQYTPKSMKHKTTQGTTIRTARLPGAGNLLGQAGEDLVGQPDWASCQFFL